MELSLHVGITITTAVTAMALLVCLLQLRTAQREMQVRWNKRLQLLQADLGAMRGKLDQMRLRLDEADQRSAIACSPSTPKDGFNLAKRTQALRLLRKGERPEQIAAVLSIPVGEAALLAKVQQTLQTDARTSVPDGFSSLLTAASWQPGSTAPAEEAALTGHEAVPAATRLPT